MHISGYFVTTKRLSDIFFLGSPPHGGFAQQRCQPVCLSVRLFVCSSVAAAATKDTFSLREKLPPWNSRLRRGLTRNVHKTRHTS